MGVPKFFRYISERYPCLSQLVSESEIPEFDNLYLDMNGIIHNCSHPNDFDPHFRITEEKIFKDIFHYIEVLFRIIKPQKLFFMAVDGVAPRAKMNQQRGRRFRSAKEAEDREKEAVRKGEALPDAERFDSNCITPGTPFMVRLQAQLQYFVNLKMSTDKMWQKVKVILSGHECPGEGEHKIMDYIRYLRSQSDYEVNTRHCLYGLDADLIMLGLCTHEPHFALLREEVKFGRRQQSKKCSSPEDTRFFLLHLSLMREYLGMEFSILKTTLNFEFDVDSVIDDWVLMGFLVGNDFIPHLPGLHISSGALPVLYKVYCDVLPSLDGYLNEKGTLNLARFDAYMKRLASFDIKQFREKYDDLRYLACKTGKNHTQMNENDIGFKRELQPFFEKSDNEDGEEAEAQPLESYDDQAIQEMMDLEEDEGSDYYDEDDREKDRLAFFQEFYLHKRNYYQDKLEYAHITPEVLRGQAEGYIKALQWNLNYYYNGICSWSWYYPHHYSPYISDIINFSNINIQFELGEPFLPFEQLLAVLPSLSKSLLPEPFQELMTDVRSPIFEYYPTDFQTDLNGKKNDWEAVVLIPFIDEKRLLKAMESCYHRLTDEEKERNRHGPMHVYTYSEESLGRYEAPAYFNAIERTHALDRPLSREDIAVPKEQLRKGLLDGSVEDVYMPGFPTFKHLKYTSSLDAQGVKIFQYASQGLNMIVKLVKDQESMPPFEELSDSLINTIAYVSWPYLTEAKIVGICTSEKKCSLEGTVTKTDTLNEEQLNGFTKSANQLKQDYLRTKGIDVGEAVDAIVFVRLFEGQKFVFNAGGKINLEKKWSNKIHAFPLLTVVRNLPSRNKNPKNVTVDDIFPVGCNCFLLHWLNYGCLGIVNERSENGSVKVRVNVPPEPEPLAFKIRESKIRYYSNNEAAYKASIPNHLLARITGTILVLDTDEVLESDRCPKVNIGLNLKFTRRNQLLPGFTRRNDNNQWLYSDRTIALIKEYAEQFPDVIRYLAENSDKDHIFKKDLFRFPGQSHMLSVISNWLGSKSELKTEKRSCDSELLEADVIADLENKIEDFMKKNKRGKLISLKLKPFYLYTPSSQIEKTAPDNAEFSIFDRVVNVRDNFAVPLGNRGTVIGIEKNAEQGLVYCDILFDQGFSSGNQYHTKKKRVYKLPDKCLLNITYAKKKREIEELKKHGPVQTKVLPPHMNSMGMMNVRPITMGNITPLMSQKTNPPALGPPHPVRVVACAPTGNSMMMNSHPPTPLQLPPQQQNQQQPKRTTLIIHNSNYPEYREQDGLNSLLENHRHEERYMKLIKSESPAKSAASPVEVPEPKEKKALSAEEEKETTQALKKLLRISDGSGKRASDAKALTTASKQDGSRSGDEKSENKGYVIELQELFQKARKGNPRYEYKHKDGNFVATLHVPGTDLVVNGDPAPTKQQAGEKAAFFVLRFLNLVKNYGDKVTSLPAAKEKSLLDINLPFLRLQHQLQDPQQQQPSQPNASKDDLNLPPPQSQPHSAIHSERDMLQSMLRMQQQQSQQKQFQMLMSGQQGQPPQQAIQPMMPPSMLQYQGGPMSPFQPPSPQQMSQQRQMTTVTTNYMMQHNMSPAAKYPMYPQQLYYQNVQNYYYNPPVRSPFPGQPAISVHPAQQPWFQQPMMPPSNFMNMPPGAMPQPPIRYTQEQMTQPSHPADKVMLPNYLAANNQAMYLPAVTASNAESVKVQNSSSQSSVTDPSTCSGRISKTPKKSRLAANFATKAAT